MVVSQKKFKPKDGDVVTTKDGQHMFINKKYLEEGCGYAYIGWNFDNDTEFIEGQWCYSRFATEEEKKLLFDKLEEEGYEWDAEKKELVKIKWKPKVGETCFLPCFDFPKFIPKKRLWEINGFSTYHYNEGWVFKTKEECQEFCNRLNNAINSVKL